MRSPPKLPSKLVPAPGRQFSTLEISESSGAGHGRLWPSAGTTRQVHVAHGFDEALGGVVNGAGINIGRMSLPVVARQIMVENLRERIISAAMSDEYEVAISAGRIVRDDNGEPVMRRKRDTNSMLAAARAYLPEFAKKVEVTQSVTVTKIGGVVGHVISHEDLRYLSREQAGQLRDILITIRHGRGEELAPERLEREKAELIEIQKTGDNEYE